jgi:hypothetical protein
MTSYFTRAIERWLERNHTQAELESLAALPKGSVHNWLAGSLPRRETLSRVLPVVDSVTASDMLRCYLMDTCPDNYRDLVEIHLREADGLREDPPVRGEKQKFEKALEWMRKEGQHNSDLVKWVIQFQELMTGGSATKG